MGQSKNEVLDIEKAFGYLIKNEEGFYQTRNRILMYLVLSRSKNSKIRFTATTLGIYNALSVFRNSDKKHPMFNRAWIAQNKLAVYCGVSKNTVAAHLKILENVHLVIRYGSGPNISYWFPEPCTLEEFCNYFPDEVRLHIEEQEKVEIINDMHKEHQPEYHLPNFQPRPLALSFKDAFDK